MIRITYYKCSRYKPHKVAAAYVQADRGTHTYTSLTQSLST